MRYVIGLAVLVLFLVVFTRGAILYPQAWGGLLLAFLPFVVLVIGIGTVVGVVQKRAEQRRDREYELFCTEHGFYYLAAPAGDQTGFDAFWLFKQGWGGALRHDISGTYGGHRFRAFEYAYLTGSGRSMRKHVQAVMAWDTGNVRLPEFTLRLESAFDSLRQLLGGSDIDFAEDRSFSNGYILQGPDEAALRDLFAPEVRAFFVSYPGQNVAAWLDQLIWWIDGKLPPPASLDAFLSGGAAVRQLFLAREQ